MGKIPDEKNRVMIHVKPATLQMPSWQIQLANAIKDPKQLLIALNLSEAYLPRIEQAHQLFPLRVTQSYLDRIEKNNIDDPLLRQILPSEYETLDSNDYQIDPVGDKAAEKTPGLIHKYKHRVLLTLTSACAIHCRYCFRRHFDYSVSNPVKNWKNCLSYIQNHSDISEVILSGGDPLSLNDRRLKNMIQDLESIEHVDTCRIHTRQVIVLPDRVDEALLDWMNSTRLKLVVVLHINHANEIDQSVCDAIAKLKNTGTTLLNQSVLLRGINDKTPVLKELSHKLFSIGILPYYLHMLDKVQGAAHYEVATENALALMKSLKAELPGYLIPKLVQEIPGESSKTIIA